MLTASSVLGTTPDPSNPLGVVGVSIPLQDVFVLTSTEKARVDTAAQSFNAIIEGLAAANELGYVDANAALAEVASTGHAFNGGVMTNAYVTGGAFSLRRSTLNAKRICFCANSIIDVINTTYNASIPKVDIGTYGTVTLHNN